jgi:hypothetical protein
MAVITRFDEQPSRGGPRRARQELETNRGKVLVRNVKSGESRDPRQSLGGCLGVRG